MRRLLAVAAPLLLAALLGFPDLMVRADEPAAPPVSRCDLARQIKVWSCDACREFMEDAALREGNCPGCGGAPNNILACEKIAYECAKDKVQAFEAGKCPKCGGELATRKDFSPIVYKCSQCDHIGNPGTECPTHKEMLHRDCLGAGAYPHVRKPKDGTPVEKPEDKKAEPKDAGK